MAHRKWERYAHRDLTEDEAIVLKIMKQVRASTSTARQLARDIVRLGHVPDKRVYAHGKYARGLSPRQVRRICRTLLRKGYRVIPTPNGFRYTRSDRELKDYVVRLMRHAISEISWVRTIPKLKIPAQLFGQMDRMTEVLADVEA